MSPEQLAKQGTESGEQKALFAWAAMAYLKGFQIANRMQSYSGEQNNVGIRPAVPPLRWLHSIPNGGARDPRTAARMKAEGLKPGIPDIFLPYIRDSLNGQYAGLYIELKKEGGRKDPLQLDFARYCEVSGYKHVFAFGWKEAAKAIEDYLT